MGDRQGVVVSFHSCVGNVGRTMALVHIAWTLAAGGHRVLALDWALETHIGERPQLDRYLAPWTRRYPPTETPGMIDWLWERTRHELPQDPPSGGERLLDRECYSVDYPFGDDGRLDVVRAGRRDRRYPYRLRYFSWRHFCDGRNGIGLLNEEFGQMRACYDYILVDLVRGPRPRYEAAYVLYEQSDVVLLTYTHQRAILEETAQVAASVRQRTRRQAICLPIAARVENAEADRRDAAQEAARVQLGPYVDPPVSDWPEAFKIPVIPYWESGPLGMHFLVTDSIWHMIASRLSNRAIPAITEDEGKRLDNDARQYELAGEQWMIYSPQAVPEPYEGDDGYAFVSYARAELDDLLVVAEALEFLGVNIWWDAAIPGATSWADELVSRIDRCDFFVLLASSRSMASHHVLSELGEAIERRKPLLTLQIESGVELPADFAARVSASQMLSVWHPDFDRDLARTIRRLQSALG